MMISWVSSYEFFKYFIVKYIDFLTIEENSIIFMKNKIYKKNSYEIKYTEQSNFVKSLMLPVIS